MATASPLFQATSSRVISWVEGVSIAPSVLLDTSGDPDANAISYHTPAIGFNNPPKILLGGTTK
jgi:hypothetical protein